MDPSYLKKFLLTRPAAEYAASNGIAVPLDVFPMPRTRQELLFFTSSPQILIGRVEVLRGAFYVTETSLFEINAFLSPVMSVDAEFYDPPQWEQNEREPFRKEKDSPGPFYERKMIARVDFRFSFKFPGDEWPHEIKTTEVGDNDGADQQKGAVTDAHKRAYRRTLGFGVPLLSSRDANSPIQFTYDESVRHYARIEKRIGKGDSDEAA